MAGLFYWARRYNAPMRTLLLVCFVSSLFAQSTKPPASPRSGEQEKGTYNEQAVPQNSPPKTAETPILAATPKQPPTQPNTSQRNNQPQSPWRKYLREAFGPAYLSNWVLALFALVAAGITLKTLNAINVQAKVARIGLRAARIATSAATVGAKAARESANTATRAADLAEKALHLTERADILLDGVTVSTYPAFTGDTVFRIVFKNFGRTRGNRLEINSRLLFVPEIKLIVEDYRPKLVAAALGAGDTLTSAFQLIQECLTQETFESIAQGKLVLRFEAEVIYFDVFDNRHRTKCSGTFMPKTCGFRVDTNQEAD